MDSTYYCEVYKYDEDARNFIGQATVKDLSAYVAKLASTNLDWDEFEFKTEPDPLSILLDGLDTSKFLGKVVNPKSQFEIVAKVFIDSA